MVPIKGLSAYQSIVVSRSVITHPIGQIICFGFRKWRELINSTIEDDVDLLLEIISDKRRHS